MQIKLARIVRYGKALGKICMEKIPDKNLRSDIMHRIRQRSESAMTVCRGSLIAKLYDDLGVENKTIILLFVLSSHSNIA